MPSRGEACGQCLQPPSQPRCHCLPAAPAGTQRLLCGRFVPRLDGWEREG